MLTLTLILLISFLLPEAAGSQWWWWIGTASGRAVLRVDEMVALVNGRWRLNLYWYSYSEFFFSRHQSWTQLVGPAPGHDITNITCCV